MSIPPEILAALQRPLQPNAPTAVPVPEMEPPDIQGMPQVTMPANEAADPLLQSMRQQGVPRKPEGFFKRSLKSFLSGFSDELTRPEREFQMQQEQTRALSDLRKQQAGVAQEGMQPVTLEGPDGTPITVPVKYAGPLIAGGFRVKTTQMQQAGATQRTEITTKSRERIEGAKIGSRADLVAAQKELAEAQAAVKRGEIDPKSPLFQQRERAIQARIEAARVSASLRERSLELAIERMNRPTTAARDRASFAESLREHIPDIVTQIDSLDQQGKLGAIAGRFNEFMTGQVGADDPEFAALRTSIGLMQTGMMVPHVGARGGVQLIKKFQGLIDSGRLSAGNLKASLGEMDKFLETYSRLPEIQRKQNSGGREGNNENGKGKVFSKSAWKKANPNGNVAQAVAAAKAAGYEVVE